MEARIFHLHGIRKRTGNGSYLYIARVCPAAGEPDQKTSHPSLGFAERIAMSFSGMVGASHFPGPSNAPKYAPKLGAYLVGWHGTVPDTISEKID
jgi:hypothetical protein